MTKPSIAIIGAGVGGCGAALRAAQLGASEVTVLEQEHPASGSSGRSAAVYNVQTTDPLNIEIRVRARELFFRLEAEHGLHLARIGNARVARTDAHLDHLRAAVEVQKSLGVHDSILLDRDQLQRLVPDLRTDDLAGRPARAQRRASGRAAAVRHPARRGQSARRPGPYPDPGAGA